jgi:hypothetical protein
MVASTNPPARIRHRGTSMVMTRIGGRDYPTYSGPNCKTCQHPDRMDIENEILAGRSYLAVHKGLPDGPEKPSYNGLLNHFHAGHLPIGPAAERALMERNYEATGRRIEEAVDDIIDHITVAEMVVKKGFERMQRGEIAPEMTDLLGAVKIVESIQARTNQDMDHEMWVSATMSMLEDARAVMSPEQWETYAKKLAANPVLKALAEKQGGTGDPEDI